MGLKFDAQRNVVLLDDRELRQGDEIEVMLPLDRPLETDAKPPFDGDPLRWCWLQVSFVRIEDRHSMALKLQLANPANYRIEPEAEMQTVEPLAEVTIHRVPFTRTAFRWPRSR